MTQNHPVLEPELDRERRGMWFWGILWWALALSPLLFPLCCCGGCGLWVLYRAPDVRQQVQQLKVQRAAEEARRNAVHAAAIETAKRALADRGHSRIAADVSATQDYVDNTRWRVTGQVLVGERLQTFTVVLRHAKFNNADHWDVQSIDRLSEARVPVKEKPADVRAGTPVAEALCERARARIC